MEIENPCQLCNQKQVTIVERKVCRDHIHMLVEIPQKKEYGFVGFFKRKNRLSFSRGNIKYKYGKAVLKL